MSLSAVLLAHAGAAGGALAAGPDLEERLAGLCAAARAAWPEIALADEIFLRHLGERLAGEPDPVAALAAVHAGDLFLASACARGEPRALAAFDRHFLSQVDQYLARSPGPPGFVDEVKQALRARLLVGEAGRPPRIAGYSGQGPLGGWVRMASARMAVDLRRAQKRHGAPAAAPAAAAAPDPELAYLKLRCRADFEAAFESTLAALDAQEASVLRLYFLEGTSTEAIAAMYQVSNRTVQRRIAETRRRILDETRRRLAERMDLSVSQIDTVMGLVQSQIDVDMQALLARR